MEISDNINNIVFLKKIYLSVTIQYANFTTCMTYDCHCSK